MKAKPKTLRVEPTPPPYPVFSVDDPVWSFAEYPMPIIYEDEGQDEMGEAIVHTRSDRILSVGIEAHLQPRAELQVASNLNCHYDPNDPQGYFSADVMVVQPFERLPDTLRSYRIGTHGPIPLLVIEILSQRSYQQRDLMDKPILYGRLGIAEYILVDVTGQFLARRLELRRRQPDGDWTAEQDADSGLTSQLGFRIIIESDNQLRVVDATTGEKYLRPEEAQQAKREREKEQKEREKAERARRRAENARAKAEDARAKAEDEIRRLKEELERLRNPPPAS